MQECGQRAVFSDTLPDQSQLDVLQAEQVEPTAEKQKNKAKKKAVKRAVFSDTLPDQSQLDVLQAEQVEPTAEKKKNKAKKSAVKKSRERVF